MRGRGAWVGVAQAERLGQGGGGMLHAPARPNDSAAPPPMLMARRRVFRSLCHMRALEP